MRTPNLALKLFVVLTSLGLTSAQEPPSTIKHLNGVVVNVQRGILRMRPTSPRAASAGVDVAIQVDPDRVKLNKSDIDFAGVKTVPTSLSELRPGDPISVTIENAKAVQINVNTPPATNGVI